MSSWSDFEGYLLDENINKNNISTGDFFTNMMISYEVKHAY